MTIQTNGPRPAPPTSAYDGFVPSMPATPSFTADEAKNREGNYILSLGLGGSGKSTFHSFLLRYLEECGRFQAKMRIPRLKSGETDKQTRLLLNQWRTQWKTGSFVNATGTSVADIREILYKVTPNAGVKAPLEFGMVEVSGELLRQVQGGRTGRQALPDSIHQLIANARVNLMLIIMVHPDTPYNDILFTNFIEYVEENFHGRLDSMNFGVIIANPDKALKQLIETTGGGVDANGIALKSGGPSPFAHMQVLQDEGVFDYMKVMAPGILNAFEAWDPKRRMITPLRLGDIQDHPDTGDARLIRFDDTDISKIFGWIYQQFTGKKLGPTVWQRIFNGMNQDL